MIYNRLLDETGSPRERLMNWADELMGYLIDYPGILYMIGTRVLQSDNKSAGLADYLSVSDTRLNPVVRELTGVSDQRLLSFKALQLISGVVYPTPVSYTHLHGRDDHAYRKGGHHQHAGNFSGAPPAFSLV